MNNPQFDHILIDAKNAIYRAVYAGCADPGFMHSGDDYSEILFRFIGCYIQRFKPKFVHVFWDAPKELLWRRGILEDYKDGRETNPNGRYPIDVDAAVRKTCDLTKELLTHLNSRSYSRERQEADDLIYAFCRLHRSESVVIVSSDGDFRQIPYLFNNVALFTPNKSELYQVEDVDPVEIRAFTGEKSDNIRGYTQIGPVRARELVLDTGKRKIFLEMRGGEIYARNRALIDLTVCPFVLHNMLYIQDILAEKPVYDLAQLRATILKHKIRGLLTEINKSLLTFKFVGQQQSEVSHANALCNVSASSDRS